MSCEGFCISNHINKGLIFQYTKIGKVMRHIATADIDKVPRDAEFQFKDRAQALVNKWHVTMQSNGEKTNGVAGETKDEGILNGDASAPTTAATGDGDVTMADTTLGDIGDLTMMSETAA